MEFVDCPQAALHKLEQHDYDLVILDLTFPGNTLQGYDALQQIKQARPDLPVIILTNSDSPEDIRTAVDCLKAGAWEYFTKANLDIRHLLAEASRAIKNRESGIGRDGVEETYRKFSSSSPLFILRKHGEEWVCAFALRLVGLCNAPRPELGRLKVEEWQSRQKQWQHRLVTSLLAPVAGREIELRYLHAGGKDDLSIILVGRGNANLKKDSRKNAEDLWSDLLALLKLNEVNYLFEPVSDLAVLKKLMQPFAVHHAFELCRKGPLITLRNTIGFLATKMPLQMSIPFALPAQESPTTLEQLCLTIAQREFPMMLSITLRHWNPETPSFNAMIPRTFGEQVSPAQEMAIINRIGELTSPSIQRGQVHVFISSPEQIPPVFLRTVGAELISSDTSLWDFTHVSESSLPGLFSDTGLVLPEPSGVEALSILYVGHEATRVFRLPIPNDPLPGIPLLRPQFTFLPPDMPSSGILLGVKRSVCDETPIYLTPDDRGKHVYVLGQTGTGKSTLLTTMILSDIREGRGLCVIDPHGDLIDFIIPRIPANRMDDVIVIDPSDTEYPIGINLLEAKGEWQRDFLTDELIATLIKEYDPNRTGIIGPQFEQATRAAARTVMDFPEGGTVIEIPRLFESREYLNYRLQSLTDEATRNFWVDIWMKKAEFHKSEIMGYLTSKFERFRQNSTMRRIVGQSRGSFDLRKVMDDGQIVLVDLAKGGLGAINSAFIGSVLVARIFAAALTRQDIQPAQRRPFCLYLDEFQNFTTDTVQQMLGEARKFGLALVMAHQNQRQLPIQILEAVLGNAGSILFFRPGIPDAERVMSYVKPYFEDTDLLDLPNWQAIGWLLVSNRPTTPFAFSTMLDSTDEDFEAGQRIRLLSRETLKKSIFENIHLTSENFPR